MNIRIVVTLILAVISAANIQAAPIRFISGTYAPDGHTVWGPYNNLKVEYDRPTELIYTFSEIRGEGYVFEPISLRLINDSEVLFSGTFGIGGLWLWVPNDSAPYFNGILGGTLSPHFAQLLGFGDGRASYDMVGLFGGSDVHYYSSSGWAPPPGEWGLYIGATRAQDAVVPEPATIIPAAAALIVFAGFSYRARRVNG